MPSPPGQLTAARLAALARLTHHRWAIPLVAECHAAPGGVGGWKYVAFLHRLGISRDSLGRTLAALIARGLVGSNPGVQHALRPEYVLTRAGRRSAPACAGLLAQARRAGVEEVILQKWSLPILAALLDGPRRFRDLRAVLPDAGPRALSLALQDLERAGLIARSIIDAYPPVADYRLTRPARRVALAAGALARTLDVRSTEADEPPEIRAAS